jgi:hypothetical protein
LQITFKAVTPHAWIFVYDASGKTVATQEENDIKTGYRISIPVESFPAGIYLIQVDTGKRRHTGKIIIKK